MQTSRRLFIGGLAAMFATPAIVRAASLMPLRGEPLQTLHMRALTRYDVVADQRITRLDVLYGRLSIHPEWAKKVLWQALSEVDFRKICGPDYPHDIRRVESLAKQMPNEIIGAELYKLPEGLGGNYSPGPTRLYDAANSHWEGRSRQVFETGRGWVSPLKLSDLLKAEV